MADYNFDQFKRDITEGVSSAVDAVSSTAKETSAEFLRKKHFAETGRDILQSGTVSSHGGNLSVCDGSSIWITRSKAMLGHLSSSDIVRTAMLPSEADQKASLELVVHRAMYLALASRIQEEGKSFGFAAIVHTHGKHTILRSLIADKIVPKDAEGLYVLGASIPVLDVKEAIGSEEVAEKMAKHISGGGTVAVVKAHGAFALGASLAEAQHVVSCLEHSAELLTLLDQTGHKL